MAARLGLTCLVLAPFVFRRPRSLGIRPADAGAIVGAGVLLGFHFLAWAVALQLTSVASAVLLISLHPVMVAALAPSILGQPLSARSAVGIVLGLGGSLVVAGGDVSSRAGALGGDLLALAGAAALAVYLVVGSRLSRRSVIGYSFWAYFIAFLVTFIVAVGGGQHLGHPLSREIALVAGLALICTIGGHTVFNWSLRHVPALAVSLSFLGEPLFTTLLAFAVLTGHPVPALTAVAGGVVALAGVVLAVPRSARAEPAG